MLTLVTLIPAVELPYSNSLSLSLSLSSPLPLSLLLSFSYMIPFNTLIGQLFYYNVLYSVSLLSSQAYTSGVLVYVCMHVWI